MEQEQIHELQSHRVVSKQSERLIQHKSKQNKERVEDRLLREAIHRQKKQQNHIFSISDLGKTSRSLGDKNRVRSKSAQ